MRPDEYQSLYEVEPSHWWFRGLRRFLQRLIPPDYKQGRATRYLDLGCGTGGLLAAQAGGSALAVGLDFSPVALHWASRRQAGALVRASANRVPFRQQFDLVTCVDVLEVASVQPDELATSFVSALRPGGYGILVVAAHAWLLSQHDIAVDSVRRYNLAQLKTLFAGQPVQTLYAGYLFAAVFPLVVFVRGVLYRLRKPAANQPTRSDVFLPSPPVNALLDLVCRLEALLLPWLRLPFGSSVVIVVEKL
ncbi:MAG: class I SAM-dependent methyltransferase [Anaerolineales bacterium]|nr:class I SAM-dependent methyltransferase [Anaerolineales bacterium]MCW5855409.1 class I SAM-dependent methyltransferase [Anaerolineales bacterium]